MIKFLEKVREHRLQSTGDASSLRKGEGYLFHRESSEGTKEVNL